MSRNDPLQNPTGTGMSGDALGRPEQGTARVESRLTGNQGAGATLRDQAEQIGNQAEELVDRASGRARETWNEAREQASDLTDRAGDLASRARSEVGGMIDRAEDRLEEQTGAVSMIRDNPLLATGLAFGVGFLLAGSGGSGKRRGLMGRASGQLRSAVLGGISTMLMQELQEMLDEHGGPAGLLSALTGRSSERGEEF
jgi:ElaB/YqjD/DUF883 family membrane-anchored ribosome-binding protein